MLSDWKWGGLRLRSCQFWCEWLKKRPIILTDSPNLTLSLRMFQPSCSLRFEDSENIWSLSRRGTGGSARLWVVMDEARLRETLKHLGWNSIEPQSDICWPIWPSLHLNNTFLWNSDALDNCDNQYKQGQKIKTAICDWGWVCFSKILYLLTFVFLTIDVFIK